MVVFSGLNITSLLRYEKGLSIPTIETSIQLADALGVSLDELFCRKNPMISRLPILSETDLQGRIREYRLVLRLSQRELADKLQITESYASFIETKKSRISIFLFLDVADVMNVPLDYLVGR